MQNKLTVIPSASLLHMQEQIANTVIGIIQFV